LEPSSLGDPRSDSLGGASVLRTYIALFSAAVSSQAEKESEAEKESVAERLKSIERSDDRLAGVFWV
jgi:hypothetical protein